MNYLLVMLFLAGLLWASFAMFGLPGLIGLGIILLLLNR
jgi:hypothetical protein